MDNPPFDPTSDEPWALDAPEAKPSLTELQDEWFAEFWQVYPRKVDRKPALKAFRRKATSEAAKNRIIAGLKRHLPAMQARDPQHVKYPATWLNADSFLEDPEPVQALNGSIRPGAAADDYPTFGARA